MATLKIKGSNKVLAPANQTLVLEALADMDQPNLLPKSFRKLKLHIFFLLGYFNYEYEL
jgi:hypothetical protein